MPEDLEKSWRKRISEYLSKDVRDVGRDVSKVASKTAKGVGKSIDSGTKQYTPDFRKAAIGAAGLAGKAGTGIKGAALGAKAAGGAAVGAGFAAGNFAFNKVREASTATMWILLTALLYLTDIFITKYNGLPYEALINIFTNWTEPMNILRILFPNVVLVLLVAYWLFRRPSSREYASFAFLIVVSSLIISLGGFYKGIYHIIFALILYFMLIYPSSEDKASANYIIAIFLLIDFFGFGLLAKIAPGTKIANRLILPIWFYLVLIYTREAKKNWLTSTVTIGVIIINVFAVAEGVQIWSSFAYKETLTQEEIDQAKGFFTLALERIKVLPKEISTGIWEGYKTGIRESTGGELYGGKVEESEDPNKRMGVYLENIQAADKEFPEDKQVAVWGDLKVRTIDVPIKISMSCKVGEGETEKIGSIVPAVLSNNYEIDKFEETNFECRFQPGELDLGINTVSINSDFDYTTTANLKTELIRKETKSSIIDSLKPTVAQPDATRVEEQIEVKEIADISGGPVELRMGTGESPISISEDGGYTYLGINVKNRWQPQGRIKKINNVFIDIPHYLDLEEKDGLYCNGAFRKIEDSETEAGGHTRYQMTENEIKSVKTPITDYESWRCTIIIDKDNVNNLLTTAEGNVYYYRAKVEYIYGMKGSADVDIKKSLIAKNTEESSESSEETT